jgi:hypothetical protein
MALIKLMSPIGPMMIGLGPSTISSGMQKLVSPVVEMMIAPAGDDPGGQSSPPEGPVPEAVRLPIPKISDALRVREPVQSRVLKRISPLEAPKERV